MIQEEENLKENHTTHMIPDIQYLQNNQITEENSSLSVNTVAFFRKANEGGNLKSEKSQDYAQTPQRNCAFTNSIAVIETF